MLHMVCCGEMHFNEENSIIFRFNSELTLRLPRQTFFREVYFWTEICGCSNVSLLWSFVFG